MSWRMVLQGYKSVKTRYYQRKQLVDTFHIVLRFVCDSRCEKQKHRSRLKYWTDLYPQ